MLETVIILCLVGNYPDGTTIFFQNGFAAKTIERISHSSFSHVAIILYNKEPWVYESTLAIKESGVVKKPLPIYLKYIEEQKQKHPKFKVYFVPPNPPYTKNELYKMKIYAESQLGRRYMIRGYILNKETPGVDCSEYVANIIEQSQRIFSGKWKETPETLFLKLTQH